MKSLVDICVEKIRCMYDSKFRWEIVDDEYPNLILKLTGPKSLGLPVNLEELVVSRYSLTKFLDKTQDNLCFNYISNGSIQELIDFLKTSPITNICLFLHFEFKCFPEECFVYRRSDSYCPYKNTAYCDLCCEIMSMDEGFCLIKITTNLEDIEIVRLYDLKDTQQLYEDDDLDGVTRKDTRNIRRLGNERRAKATADTRNIRRAKAAA